MRRRLTILAATSVIALVLSASPAMASPVQHWTLDATDPTYFEPITCGPRTYTFVAGQFTFVFRDATIGSHVIVRHVWAEDEAGRTYRLVGSETYAAPNRFTAKLLFISRTGGVVDSVNISGHASPNGSWHYFDIGSCGF